MKKKGIVLLCVASCVCMISVICLLGSMGLYAEKRGTKEWTSEYSGHEESTAAVSATLGMETSEMQTMGEAATERKTGEAAATDQKTGESAATDKKTEEPIATEEDGLLSDKELQNIWNKMYTGYIIDTHEEQLKAKNWEAGEIAALFSDMDQYTAEYPFLDNMPCLTVHEAGLLILKETNRLFQEKFGSYFVLNRIVLDAWQEENGRIICRWEGLICNVFPTTDPNYRSYQFTIDAISGKITELGEFHPYRKKADYYKSISWTDEEIVQIARRLVETYQLDNGETLDWSNIRVYNGQEDLENLQDELEEPDTAMMLDISVMFFQDGKKQFYLLMDYETGALNGYLWSECLK